MDYRAVAQLAEDLGRQRIALIESFARRLATHCLALPGGRTVEIRVHEPQALAAGIASGTMLLRRDTPNAARDANRCAMIEEDV